jgi:DNA-binding beta-propeller fold protein YncE
MKRHRIISTAVFIALAVLLLPVPAMATNSYDGYVWNTLDEDVRSINGYIYDGSIDGSEMDIGAFNSPEDIFIAEDDTIYITDTGNSRVVQLDRNNNVIKIIGDDEGAGQLNEPKGVFVGADGTVYVADTKNGRIALFDKDGTFIKELTAPKSPLLGKDFSYSPSKLVVDKRKYLFVTSDGVTQGLMQIDPNGEFKGFYGANHVEFSWMRLFTKAIATEEQEKKMNVLKGLAITNVDIDEKGFIYTTTLGEEVNQVKRLSPVGVDTLNINGAKKYGDRLDFGPSQLPQFVDITVNQTGLISALDLLTGKVFQYDKLGNLLFIFGGLGDQDGLFLTPSSVDQTSDGTLYVVDKGRNRIDFFLTTPFADLVHEASDLYVNGEYDEAQTIWMQVLELNENFDVAYAAIGKALLKSERYKEAKEYFRVARDREQFAIAYREYRKEFIREHFGQIVALLVSLYVAVKYVIPWALKRRSKISGEAKRLKSTVAQEGDTR